MTTLLDTSNWRRYHVRLVLLPRSQLHALPADDPICGCEVRLADEDGVMPPIHRSALLPRTARPQRDLALVPCLILLGLGCLKCWELVGWLLGWLMTRGGIG
jgi:hypothetical protein